jgi:hypothetical protein
VKTVYSGRLMSIDSGMLELLKSSPQTTQFSGDNDWVFASPVKLGRLPVSYPSSRRESRFSFHHSTQLRLRSTLREG